MVKRVSYLDACDRNLLIIDLADRLEKYVDFGELYSANNQWVIEFDRQHRQELLTIAQQLDNPKFVTLLSTAFEQTDQVEADIPDILRTTNSGNGPFAELLVPLSCRYRWEFRLKQSLWHLSQRLRHTAQHYLPVHIRQSLKRYRHWVLVQTN